MCLRGLRGRPTRRAQRHDGTTRRQPRPAVLFLQPRRARSSGSSSPRVDRFLDLADLRRHLATFYSHTGRPSIDPGADGADAAGGLPLRHSLGAPPVRGNAPRLGVSPGLPPRPEDTVPDPPTSRTTDTVGSATTLVPPALRVARGTLHRSRFSRRRGFAIDASIIRADANRRRGVLATLPIGWPAPEQRSRAVREYLAALDEAEPVGSPPKHVSMTHPAARWTAAPGCPAYYAYSTNYLVDVECGVIVDVEATAAHCTEETEATKTMIKRVEERHDLKLQRPSAIPRTVPVPCSSGSCRTRASNRTCRSGRGRRDDGTFSISYFRWDEEADEYRCPQGQPLRSQWRAFSKPRSHITQADTIIYRSSQQACAKFH